MIGSVLGTRYCDQANDLHISDGVNKSDIHKTKQFSSNNLRICEAGAQNLGVMYKNGSPFSDDELSSMDDRQFGELSWVYLNHILLSNGIDSVILREKCIWRTLVSVYKLMC